MRNISNTILILAVLMLSASCSSAQNESDSKIINGVNYDKPLDIEMTESGIDWDKNNYTTEYKCHFTYNGDSLARVDFMEDTAKTIYEFEWEGKTKNTYITDDNVRKLVMTEVYNNDMQLLNRKVNNTFRLRYEQLLYTEGENLWNARIESDLRKTYDSKGRILEIRNEFQPHWINVSKFEYNGKIVTEYIERYQDDTVRLDPKFIFKANVKEYLDDDLTLLKRSYSLNYEDEIRDEETFTYYPDGRMKTKNGKTIPYDQQGRVLEDERGRINYKTFEITGFLGIKVKYLDDKFDKIVSYNIMGMKVDNQYDKFGRPVKETLENGTSTSPDFDAEYLYDDNVTVILRHERGFLDKKGEKTITKNIRVTYEKAK